MKVALFGLGYWGKKVYQTLLKFTFIEEIVVVDPTFDKENLPINLPKLNFSTKKDVLANSEIEHCFVITPEETHFLLVKELLSAKKNVFVEKPLCFSKKEAVELVDLADSKKCRLFVDNIFLFDPATKLIKKLIDEKEYGQIKGIQSIRYSVNIFKPKITVFEDLIPHDIYLAKFFLGSLPKNVQVRKIIKRDNQIKEGNVDYFFQDFIYTGLYSWIKPTPRREMSIKFLNADLLWSRKNDADYITITKNGDIIDEHKTIKKISPLEESIMSFFDNDNDFQTYIDEVTMLESVRAQYSFV